MLRHDQPRPTPEERANPAAAIIVPCTSRKFARPAKIATAVNVTEDSQSAVETAWCKRLNELPAVYTPETLYGGRGFQLSRQAAASAQAPLFIISAGLGLVREGTRIPSYGLTVADRGADSIAARIKGEFSPAHWWRAINSGPFAHSFARLFEAPLSGSVIMALTKPYALLMYEALESLSTTQIARLRIVGLSIADALPSRIRAALLPYDERLNGITNGTRSDFSQRALVHFIEEGLKALPDGSIDAHRDWVSSALDTHKFPETIDRIRKSDEEIVALIANQLADGIGSTALHKKFRQEWGFACEQSRFSRLYRVAVSGASK